MVSLTFQAPAEDHSHGADPVPADLWDSSELSVPGRVQGGDTHAAELPQLHPAAARLYDHPLHPKRSGYLNFSMFSMSPNLVVNKGFVHIYGFRNSISCCQKSFKYKSNLPVLWRGLLPL